jgi:serine/threonine-protein kinase RsbW
MSTTEELVRLEIPAQPAFVGVARTVVVAVASSVTGIDDDRLEDLRIAVSEACTTAVEAHDGDGAQRVVLRCAVDAETLEIRIEDGAGLEEATRGASDGPPPPQGDAGWGIQLIQALVDGVSFDHSGGGSSVRLAMRRRVSEPDD